jgi:uncharacterized lipoprotein YehR (DUF1307 family)
MKKIKTLILFAQILAIASLMIACSDNEENKNRQTEAQGDHIWKHQTDTLKTSKDAAKKLQESLNLQQQKLDENN